MIGDRFMCETHLRQPEFTYNACGLFTKHCERIKKFKELKRFKVYLKIYIKNVYIYIGKNSINLVLFIMLPMLMVKI